MLPFTQEILNALALKQMVALKGQNELPKNMEHHIKS